MNKLITIIMFMFTITLVGCGTLPQQNVTASTPTVVVVNSPDSIETLLNEEESEPVVIHMDIRKEEVIVCDKALPPPIYTLPPLRTLTPEELGSYLGTAKALIGMIKEHQELIRKINEENQKRYLEHSESCRLG